MDFNPFKYKISDLNALEVQKGRVLIAEPFMQDPYFKRSVVLITEHSKDGAVGFILNQSLGIEVQEVLPDFPEIKAPVFLGGPVNPQNLFFVHNCASLPGAIQIAEKLYWDGDFDLLQDWLKVGKISTSDVRFFLGYSGWDFTQLNDELEKQSWLISELDAQHILNNRTELLWKHSLQAMGKEQAILSSFPEDPSLN
ncbi:MAG: YqgE/AlgH family protein [Vicingaceae bacterium]